MNYYDKNGYIDMEKIMAIPCPFIFLVHGRGTGKTYGICKFLLDHLGEKFLFMRRTQTEADTISFTDFSPFQPVLNDNPEYPRLVVQSLPNVRNLSGVYVAEEQNGKLVATGEAVGYIGALSTISNVRGFNGEMIKYWVLDEFIPERGARSIGGSEGDRVLNCFETLNRNRELKGQPPLKAVFLSNANRMDSPVFQSLGILDKIDRMTMRGQNECIMHDRGIAILKLKESPISIKKAETALYKATGDDDFKNMSLLNSFSADTYMYCKTEPIQEYRPIFSYEDIFVYKHKSEQKYYVTRHRSGGMVRQYFDEEFSRRRMKREQGNFLHAWLVGRISFEDVYCKTKMIDSL